MDVRVRITGFGGQGVITAGFILGRAASIHDDRHAIFTQSYGPEARGSACASRVVISDHPILNPFFKKQDILVALSQEGFDKYIENMADEGIVLIDEDLVETHDVPAKILKKYPFHRIPTTRLAENEFDKKIVANIIMLGFVTTMTKVVTPEAMKAAVAHVAPRGTEKLNENALNFGLSFEEPKTKKAKSR